MPFFFIIFWGAILIFLCGGLIVSGILTGVGWRRNRPMLKWVSSAVLAFFALTIGVLLAALGYGFYRSSNPRLVFEDTFHERQPPGTVVLHGRSGGLADSAAVDLAFRTDRATFDRLRPSTLNRKSLKEYQSFSSYFTQPWWREATGATEIWMDDSSPRTTSIQAPGQRFYSEVTFMTWDADGLVQYMWSGID